MGKDILLICGDMWNTHHHNQTIIVFESFLLPPFTELPPFHFCSYQEPMDLIGDTWGNLYEVGCGPVHIHVSINQLFICITCNADIHSSLAPLSMSSRCGEGHTLSCQLLFPQQLWKPICHHKGPSLVDSQKHRVWLHGNEITSQTGFTIRWNQQQPHQ